MADDVQGWAAFVPLVSVIIGAVIGIAGSVLGPLVLELRKQEAEKRRKRTEKFEELVAALYEHRHWLDTMEQYWVFGSTEKVGMSPLAKVQAIAAVYFPDFTEKIAELDKVTMPYYIWMMNAAQIRIKTGTPSHDGLLEVYEPYDSQFQKLLYELVAYARLEFSK